MATEVKTAGELAGEQARLLENILQISVQLSATTDRRQMLDTILAEARRLSGAQAGSLYVRRGERLQFVVAQNDEVSLAGICKRLEGVGVELGGESLAGFVATTGQAVNIPDSYKISPGAPFRINRDFDAATGYRTQSILALPLMCPNGQVVGVLQLINRIGADGKVEPFPDRADWPLASLASMAAVSVHNALLTEQLKQAHLDTVIRLAVVAEFRDKETADHIRRISHVCAMLARAMGLDEPQVELIEYASTMHDIGKVGIPDSILLKPGALTPDERRIVETHATVGAEILARADNDLMKLAHQIALCHHERWDGKGYPQRLKGEQVPLAARIVCLADVFDALATKRCYKDAYPIEKVVEIIQAEKAGHFDPAVVEAFLSILDPLAALYRQHSPAASPTPGSGR